MGIQRDGRGDPDPYISGVYEVCRYHGAWYAGGYVQDGSIIQLSVLVLQNGIPYQSASGPSGVVGSTIADNGVFYCDVAVAADTTFSHRVGLRSNDGSGWINSNTNAQVFKSCARAVQFSSLSAATVSGTELSFYGLWNPTTNESTGTAYLYYKKTTDASWTLHSTYGPYSGDSNHAISVTLSGLDYGTSYQFYIYVARNVSNSIWSTQGTGNLPAANASSSVVSAITLAATPTVTTEDASSISHNSAQLNGTIDANSLPMGGVDVTFLWNTQAYRRVAYENATNITNGSVLTIGAITYTFLENSTATGRYDYSGNPASGEYVVIGAATYTFITDTLATGGQFAYNDAINPADGETVTIPDGTAEDPVYRFVEETTASDGTIDYINGTNPSVGMTVTIPTTGDDAVYTFVSTVVSAGDVKRGGSADQSMQNLERAINQSGGTEGAGNDYIAWDNAPHPLFSALLDAGTDRLTLSALGPGPNYNVNVSSTSPSFTIVDPAGGNWVAEPGDVLIGADADATMLNLERAINQSGGTEGVGDDYISWDNAAHLLFSASLNAGFDYLALTALDVGGTYNVTLSTTAASITPTDPTGGLKVETPGDVRIGATEDDTFLSLTRAINNSGGSPGVDGDYIAYDYGSGESANIDVSAAHDAGGNGVDLTALESGAAGNGISISDSSTVITTTVMSGGADLPGGGYQILIGATADETMLNLQYGVNKSGGVENINYVAAAAHPYVVADRNALDNYVSLVVPTNSNPTLVFSTDEPTFTLSSDTEDPWSHETAVQNFTNDGTTPVTAILTGLEIERKYFFKAKAVYYANGGGTLYGDDKEFTTAAEPLAASLEEEHMQTIQFDGQYGVATTVTFTLRSPSGSSSDLFYTGTAPVQADCLVFKDGVYDSTSDNAPTQVGTYLYKITLSATEMSCETLDLVIHDASGGAFRDQHIQVRTAMRLSELDIDASQGPTDASAITAIGNADGHGIIATSTGDGSDINAVLSSMYLRVGYAQTQSSPSGVKIKLDANASPTDNYYNGCVVVTLGGDGAGQARVVTAYNGGQREATVDSTWSTIPNNTTLYGLQAGSRPWSLAPDAELASVPGPTAGYGEMLQLLFQRFAFKIDQTASAQTWYDSSGNAIFDRSVSDDGVTQTVEALANV